jgi:hypothetical protein
MRGNRIAKKGGSWAVFLALGGVACGGSQATSKDQRRQQVQSPAQQEEERAAEEARVNKELDDAVPKLWANMDGKERYRYMENTVMPAMKTVFETYDPNRYAKMTCESCHGADAEARKFAMPNPELPTLTGMNDFAAARAKFPGAVEFMMSSVELTMASLLQEPVYNAKTRKGFGCFRCHTHAGGGHGKAAPTPK